MKMTTSGDIILTNELKNDIAEIPIEDLYESEENPLVPGRICGSCTMCCTVMEVWSELNKPAGVTCSHLAAGLGCTIRDERPQACRRFFCGWRLDPNIDSLWKPDISGFVLTISLRYGAMLVMVDPTRPLAWKVQPYYGRLKEWSARAFKEDKRIVAVVGSDATVLLPDRDVPIGVLGPDDEIVLSRPGNAYHAEKRKQRAVPVVNSPGARWGTSEGALRNQPFVTQSFGAPPVCLMNRSARVWATSVVRPNINSVSSPRSRISTNIPLSAGATLHDCTGSIESCVSGVEPPGPEPSGATVLRCMAPFAGGGRRLRASAGPRWGSRPR